MPSRATRSLTRAPWRSSRNSRRMVKRRPGERHLRGAGGLDLGHVGGEVRDDVGRVGGGVDGGDGAHLGDFAGRGQHRRAAERMADQELRSGARRAQERGCRNEVGDVRGEVGVGELALARAEAGEVEAQHREPSGGQGLGDPRRGEDVLRAGEAMGEDSKGPRRADRQVEPGGEHRAVVAGKVEPFRSAGAMPVSSCGFPAPFVRRAGAIARTASRPRDAPSARKAPGGPRSTSTASRPSTQPTPRWASADRAPGASGPESDVRAIAASFRLPKLSCSCFSDSR